MPPTYENRTKDELQKLAAEREIEGRSSMSKDELIAALRGGDEPEPKAEPVSAVPSAKTSTALELIADPLEQKVVDNEKLIHEALVAVDEALTSEEEAHAPDLMAARLYFQSSQYATPFRFLIALAYAAGHGKKPLD